MDMTELRRLVTAGGPFASVHFDESHDTEDAAKQLQLRLKEMEAALDEQGADRPTVEAILSRVRESTPPVGQAGRSVLAAHGEVVVDQRLAAPPAAQEARYSALPYFLPIVTHAEDAPTYLVVLVDSAGAEIEVYRGHTRAEETSRHELDDVAARIAKTAEQTGARLIVLAGEVQARTGLHDLLPEPARRITSDVGAGRAAGADRDELDRRIHELLTGRRLAGLDDLAERFRAEAGRNSGLAVSGLEGVTAALSEGNVATLLVGEPGGARVLTGPEPTQIGVAKPRLDALGVTDPVLHRADEALPYAAVAVGAEVVAMDERLELTDGFGALLRHS